MFILYDLIFFIFGLISLPYLVFKKKIHPGFYSRLGELPGYRKLEKPIWLHAVSVGEAMAIRSLADGLRKKYPFKRLVISTVTPTGNKIAKSIAKDGDYVFYLPFDLSLAVKRVIRKIDPALFVIIETEIWPNLISYLHQNGAAIAMVNGRISDRSFKGYFLARFFLRPILKKISLFCVQTQIDKERLIRLGAPAERVKVTGNMKFDLAGSLDLQKHPVDQRKRLGLSTAQRLLLAGSTHPGEEEMILQAYYKLSKDYPDLKLLIAPRHPERSREVEKITLKHGFKTVMVSQLKTSDNRPKVLILDSVGELLEFYNIAEVVFVGGSLVPTGGHNILEPAVFAKPVLIGPYMFNFKDITEVFLSNRAAVSVKDSEELYRNIRILLDSPEEASGLGQRARSMIEQKRGATEGNLKWINYIFNGT